MYEQERDQEAVASTHHPSLGGEATMDAVRRIHLYIYQVCKSLSAALDLTTCALQLVAALMWAQMSPAN